MQCFQSQASTRLLGTSEQHVDLQDVAKAARFPRMFSSNLNKQVEKFTSLSFSHHLSFFSRVEYYTQYSSGVRGALYIVILLLYSSQNNNKKQEGCVQVRHQRDYQVGYNGLLTLTLLPILDQNHKGSVHCSVKTSKSSTSDKLQTFKPIFGISCKVLAKNSI